MAARRNAQAAAKTTEEPAVEPETVVKAAPDGDGVEVDLSPEADEDDDPAEAKDLSRREKKQHRQSLREEAERLRAENLELERRSSQAFGYLQALQQQQPKQDQVDPIAEEKKSLRRQQDVLRERYLLKRDKLTEKERDEMLQEGYDLEDKMRRLAVREEMRGMPQPQQQVDPIVMTLQAEHPEVFQDERLLRLSVNEYQRRVLEGEVQGLVTGRAAIKAVLERRGGQSSERQSPETQKRRYEGGATGGAGVGQPQKRTVKLSSADVRAAKAAFPHLSEAKALREYALAIQESD